MRRLATVMVTVSAAAMLVAVPAVHAAPKATDVASVSVAPVIPRVPKGYTVPLVATATLTGGGDRDVTGSARWSVTSNVLKVSSGSGKRGVVRASKAGQARVDATYGGVTGSALVTVTNATLVFISVYPAGGTVAVGQTMPLVPTGTFSDGTAWDLSADATWTSSDRRIATMSGGLVVGVSPGTASITVSSGAVSTVVTVTVTAT